MNCPRKGDRIVFRCSEKFYAKLFERKLFRYNETDKMFWHKMYSTSDRTESTSIKMDFDSLHHMGYFNYNDYSAKPDGKVVSGFWRF